MRARALAFCLGLTGALATGLPGAFAQEPATSALGRGINASAPPGPCTEAAKRGLPDGEAHDHQDVAQHRGFRCRIEQVDFLPLKRELAARPEAVLGEMDVERDLAAVAVIYPEGGVLFFDVSNPDRPRFLSWYRGSVCEGVAIANNCGAFVDLSSDGTTAFLSVQSLTVAPYPTIDPSLRPASQPGVEVIDVRNRERPQLVQAYPVLSLGGVHTSTSHVIPAEGSTDGGPRAPGEYLYSIANGFGVEITRVNRTVAGPQLTPVTRIDSPGVHDTFAQNDPITRRTYLYLADGFTSGFKAYDVTDPSRPRFLAEWDLTPECGRDWYAHTIDVTHRGNRRYVTLPAELFTSGAQSAPDQARGCGRIQGNGDVPGPLWIIDASDFSTLGQAADRAAGTLKKKSEDALIATWTNPAERPAGNLFLSPHNQQIVGDRIYLSSYHAGVFVLDASGAFAGKQQRPSELGHIVPNAEASMADARPDVRPGTPLAIPRARARPSIWDMYFYKGYILAPDQVGGFYSLRYDGDARDLGLLPGGTLVVGRRGGRFLVSRRALHMSRRGIVRFRVSCRDTRPCRGSVRLRTATRFRRGRGVSHIRLGRRSFSVPAKRRTTVSIRLSASARRLVTRLRRVRVLVVANVSPAGPGELKRTTTASFRLVAPPRR